MSVLTKEKAEGLLDVLMIRAKEQRSAIPFSQDDSFPMMVVFIGPNTEDIGVQPVQWRNEEEKYWVMRNVSAVARELLCQAVALISDTRWTVPEEISEKLGIPELKDIGLDEWQKKYLQARKERFGGYVGNMPRDWYHEAIVIAAKGPTIGTVTRMACYVEGPNDKVKFVPQEQVSKHMEGETTEAHFNLLHDWWS